MLTLILTAALGQWAHGPPPGAQQYDPGSVCQRTGGRCFKNRSGNRPAADYAFFEFAPASGAGMGSACACAAITGAKGETLTFTRTGNATCSKQGLATTGIANGDLVVCAGDQPRVESSGGVLGLRVEGARTNEALRSSEFDNAVWLDSFSGVAAPTVTANAAVAPDGTLTADRLQISATTSGQYSYRYQSGFSSVERTTSVYIRGNGTSGTINLLSGSTPNACVACPYVAGSWSRCELVSATTASTFFFLGNDSASAVCTTSSKGAQDVFVWGFQHETGPYATSYIPTVAAAVTRNAEAPYLTMPVTVSPRSWAATSTVPFALANVNNLLMDVRSGVGVTDFVELFHRLGTAHFGTYAIVSSSPQQVNGTVALGVPGTNRAASWYAPAGTLNVISNGTTESAATALGALPALDRVYLGTYVTTGAELNGIVSRVCVDPSPTRCR